MPQADNGLIVPVDITALCVGIKDQEDANGTSTFAGATTTFINQTGIYDAFLGSNVVRKLTDAPLDQLKKGVHLHWALPEALTRGNYDPAANQTNFAVTPNRWLLSRIIITSGVPSRTSWIIESDGLYDAGVHPTDAVVTLPVKTLSDKEQNYRYTGISALFTTSWNEPADPNRFKDLTGQDLSAVANGDTCFAAFYPNSRNIFGFYDDMDKLDGPIDVMYQVTGWYSQPVNDPLNGGKTKDQLQTAYGWTFKDSDATPVYSFYSGLTEAITWNVKTSYIVDSPNQGPIPAAVTIGNNPSETFSAYFKKRLHPDIDFFEDLLNAFQTGILPIFKEPEPGQLSLLQELLHGKQFNPSDAGITYLIVQKPDEDDINDPGNDTPATDLPLQMGISLNQLNIVQQQYDYYTDYDTHFKGTLFGNWYRLMKADDDGTKNELDAIIRAQIGYYEDAIFPKLTSLKNELDAQLKLVNDQLGALNEERRIKPQLELKETPASRYWQPNEPVLLLTAPEFAGTARFSVTASVDADGYLICRINDQLLSSIVVNNITITAAQFNAIDLPGPNNLPQSAVFNSLIEESCLLNTNIVSSLTGIAANVLQDSLQAALDGASQSTYTFTGLLPAPKAVRWWNGNPWNPIMVIWEADFSPLQPTMQGENLQQYSANFFSNNYDVDQNAGGFITYKGPSDPTQFIAHNREGYSGSAILTLSAADSFAKQLAEYLEDHTDKTLQTILDDLGTGKYVTFSINGFGNSLIMQDQDLQLNVKVPDNNPYAPLTESVSDIVGDFYSVSPEPNGFYNPIRAGYLNARLTAVDVYGNKREIQISDQCYANSMISWYNGKQIPETAFLPPRISQPSRLIFRWLSADGDQSQEMTVHPATTPICGWVMPNHLDASLFFYDQQGHALGTMFLDGDHTTILWQSAPGDNKTINQSVASVFAYQNSVFAAFAESLATSTPAFFLDFWTAVDSMHNFVNPSSYAQNNDLAVLIGRPVAITQAMLRLEAAGSPAANQSWYTLEPEDNGFTGVQFPVILGDLDNIDDGLIGYFKQGTEGYDFSSFYSEAATGTNGVVKPAATNLLVNVSPKIDAPDPANVMQDAVKVLMLVDPRASIYATSGIQPVMTIEIPPDEYTDIVSTLEMTFLTTPVLQGITGFNLPLPAEEGYQWSWVEETLVADKPVWAVVPDISFTTSEAIAAYTPQAIREGWLRLNPQLLSFTLQNPLGQPVAVPGQDNDFILTVKNRKPTDITFKAGQLLPEGDPNTGAVFYLHFGQLIGDDKVPDIAIARTSWTFKCLNNLQYGNYWACTPSADTELAPGAEITFNITKAFVAENSGQVQVYVDFMDVTGVNNGTDASLLSIIQ
ncbi:hypothetical protein [Chitinophaga caseinilytica]|uniref:Uncharacterized protein n=1 Tax=Chitinophaga caseinilytica TaxID=2267521 RepID=A0ABZ2ZCQ2_9BACT